MIFKIRKKRTAELDLLDHRLQMVESGLRLLTCPHDGEILFEEDSQDGGYYKLCLSCKSVLKTYGCYNRLDMLKDRRDETIREIKELESSGKRNTRKPN